VGTQNPELWTLNKQQSIWRSNFLSQTFSFQLSKHFTSSKLDSKGFFSLSLSPLSFVVGLRVRLRITRFSLQMYTFWFDTLLVFFFFFIFYDPLITHIYILLQLFCGFYLCVETSIVITNGFIRVRRCYRGKWVLQWIIKIVFFFFFGYLGECTKIESLIGGVKPFVSLIDLGNEDGNLNMQWGVTIFMCLFLFFLFMKYCYWHCEGMTSNYGLNNMILEEKLIMLINGTTRCYKGCSLKILENQNKTCL